MSTIASVLYGAEAACGLLFVFAGFGKAYQAARGGESDTALRRLLRMPVRRWRWVELGTGVAEIATAVAVAVVPAAAGIVMAALGTVFCGLLWRVKAAGIPGGCNCLGTGRRYAADSVGVRDVARAALLAVVGVAAAVVLGSSHYPFRMKTVLIFAVAGFAVAGAALTGLSVPPVRRACNRPLLAPVRGTLRALAGHLIYQAMATSAGPFAPEIGHRRAGCDDEFWFTPASGGAPVVFGVAHNGTGAGQGLTVRTTRARPGTAPPARRIIRRLTAPQPDAGRRRLGR